MPKWIFLNTTKGIAMTYEEFIESKKKGIQKIGFKCENLNPRLKDFQKFCVEKAILHGRYALFHDCGLGKTFQQLEIARLICEEENGRAIILCPLAVSGQTIAQGDFFGIPINRLNEKEKTSSIDIVNYDQIDSIDADVYCCVILDESSILKNADGKLRNAITSKFSNTKYRFCFTATPSPNDPMEICTHAEFLGIANRDEILSMYFVHDGGETTKWRIKGHAEDDFWGWVASWSTMIAKPSDIGFSDDGYVLPPLRIHEHKIETENRGEGSLFNEVAISATNFNSELRATLMERMLKAADIANGTSDQVIVWIKQDIEEETICKLIPGAVPVRGGMPVELKEKRLLGFAKNEFRVLVTKMKIAQFGLNYQNCHIQIVASLDFSFEGMYQAMRRSYRFGQKHPVDVHIISTDTMVNVSDTIKRKELSFANMQEMMKKHSNSKKEYAKMKIEVSDIETPYYTLMHGDCVKRIKEVKSDSIGFSIFSPPFASLYTYSDHVEDMGNSKNYDEFCFAFSEMVKDLYRIMWSGRNVAVHCMDLPIQKGKEGYIGLRDFSGLIRDVFESAGFIYHSRVTIWKDPVVEMQRTKALGLLHKQVKKDSAMSRVGIPDYLMVFRKDGEHNHPVRCTIDVDTWQKYASPVWMDIDYGDTLNAREAREDKDEKHICPLQLGTIKRAMHLWSNEGDTVFTPFAGIGSEVYQSIVFGRKGIGIELKESYFNTAKKNAEIAVERNSQQSLF